ncbi:MAG: FadR family transcriptional regulator [Proteobacteria bacterium]|nr:FadR family transcriptional regulator [Pseudomonadota bacterium]
MRGNKNSHGRTLDLLGEAIVGGRYPAGGAMPPEPVLCEQLGVSRTVVREAVKSLVAKGLVVTGPKVGTRVLTQDKWNWFDPDVITWQASCGLTHEFVRDLHDLRRAVEPAAARLAAQRITPQHIEELETAYAGMKEAIENGGDYMTFDLRFHHAILNAADNRLIVQMNKVLHALLRTSFEISTSKPNGPALSLPLHRAVLDALVARNPAQAEAAVAVLIDSAREDIDEVLGSRRRLPRLSRPPPHLKAAPRAAASSARSAKDMH